MLNNDTSEVFKAFKVSGVILRRDAVWLNSDNYTASQHRVQPW
jgi:hypothetical protein